MAKKTPGRLDKTTPEERQEVALLKASGLSNRAIARKTNRARQTIANVLAGEDVERLRVQARDILDRKQVDLAEHFMTAVQVGASKGRYEGAYHGLLSLGVISRPDDTSAGPRTVVNIGQVITGAPGRGLPEVEDRVLPVAEVGRSLAPTITCEGGDHD